MEKPSGRAQWVSGETLRWLDCAHPTVPGSGRWVNAQGGGGCVLAGKGSGNGRSILGSPWHRSGEKDTEGEVKDEASSQGMLGIRS